MMMLIMFLLLRNVIGIQSHISTTRIQPRSDLSDAVYSVLGDFRAADWPTSIPESISQSDLARLLPVKIPLLNVVIWADLSDPEDLTTVDFLLVNPLPIEVHVKPRAKKSSQASKLLAGCFSTIFRASEDRERFSDFLRALADFARIRTEGPYNIVREEEAKLACRVFTQDLAVVEKMILELPETDKMYDDQGISPGTVFVNGVRINKATIEKVYPQLVKSQSELFVPIHRSDEL